MMNFQGIIFSLIFGIISSDIVMTSDHHSSSSSSSHSSSLSSSLSSLRNEVGGLPLQVNLTVGYMTGSSRKPGDQEYSRPGHTISGALTLALSDLKSGKFFKSINVYTNGSRVRRDSASDHHHTLSSSGSGGGLEIGFHLEIAETFGDEDTSVRQVANLWKKNVSVIIGPQETCLHEARLASSLNIPMISYFCSDEETSDKARFPTFSRTRPPDAAISRAVAALLLKYGWTSSLTLIYSDSTDDQRFRRVAKSLSILLQKQNVTTREEISYRGPYYHGYVDNPFDSIVAKTKDNTRIYIVISEYFEHLGLVLALEKHKLLDKGEYLVIGVSMDDYKEEEWNPRRYFKGLLRDEVDKEDPAIFRSYIGIVASPPRNFTDFSHRVNDFMEKEPFNFSNPLKSLGGYKKIRIEAAYLYDAVILYAQALQSIFEEYQQHQQHQFKSDHHNGNASTINSGNASHFSSTSASSSSSSSASNSNYVGHNNNNNPEHHNHHNHGQSSSSSSMHSSSNSLKINKSRISLGGGGGSGGSGIMRSHSHSRGNNNNNNNSHGHHHNNNNSPRSKSLLSRLLDGREISQKLRKISYRSATGHESEMDERGDAKGNFTLVSLKNKNGEFGLYPVGFFVKQSQDSLPELKLTEEIEWVAGTPPVSEPKCGFAGERCLKDHNTIIVSSILMMLFVLTASGAYLVFRHWRLSRDMDTILWRIDKRDIHWENGQFFPVKSGSQASLAKFSTVFAPLVTYRERIFAAKAVDTDLLDSTMKHQLRNLREIRHENLNAFIGACLYDEGILLIQEYCSRGSIKDILDNGDLKLDDMFVSSLVGDLLRGLSYLHDSSQFRYHGNLKPTNCLIDSRWVLKLSDFGLTYARKGHYISHHGGDMILTPGSGGNNKSSSNSNAATNTATATTRISFANTMTTTTAGNMANPTITTTAISRTGSGSGYNSSMRGLSRTPRIATSPYLPPEFSEICKNMQNNRSMWIDNHKKGDIYSLGVILWELLRRESLATFLGMKDERDIRAEIARQGMSFWPQTLTVLYSEPPPPPPGCPPTMATNCLPRPIIPTSVLDCLKDCLCSDPDQRPDIKSVRLRLRPLHKGMRSNIFDIMIGLMEKYANNLEILVDERTKQLSEEKRKTDSLLYELIPASVAEELKEGLRVPAQAYDCVSIYFSDIVGFTSMSAQSSALEVVEFLNDLYTCFDSVIENFDVYKVETIGDAYMVASGLPVVREGNFHAHEMARMALQLLETVTNFRIRHRPNNETVKLRIGVHSGPCCAGVVGLKRPRYCLFGDTVNTASRMESTGMPLRIHCSQTFARLAEDEFVMETRGVVDVKGKGDMTTYWLIGPKEPTSTSSHLKEQ